MPTRKLINNYIFYKIVNINNDVELCYVGSTVNFKERVRTHRIACNNVNGVKYNRKVYQTIREHGGWEEFKMVEVGYAQQVSFTQARVIEEQYRVELKAELNSRKCYSDSDRTEYIKEYNKQYKPQYYQNNKEKIAEQSKEYRQINKEKIAEYKKEYYEANKDKIAEKGKEYREINKDKVTELKKEYYEANKEKLAQQQKEYREINKDKVTERKKEYYEANKEKINERNKEKITCECGCVVTKHHLPRHKLTQKHIDFINNISNT